MKRRVLGWFRWRGVDVNNMTREDMTLEKSTHKDFITGKPTVQRVWGMLKIYNGLL